MSYKLVIKGQSENAEFPAVDSAEIPRLALYDGTYIPLVEDDGSDGTTLKVRIDDKVYRIESGGKFTDWEFLLQAWSTVENGRLAVNSDFEIFYATPSNTTGVYTELHQAVREVKAKQNIQAYLQEGNGNYVDWRDYTANARIAGATTSGVYRLVLARLKNKKMNFTECVLVSYTDDSNYVKFHINSAGAVSNAGQYVSVSFASGVNISIPPFAGKVKIVKDNSLIMTAMCDYGFTYNSSSAGVYGVFLQAYEEIALPEFEFMWQYEYSGEKGMLCGNPKTGIEYAKLPYDGFNGQLLKQLCPTTYRAPFRVSGQAGGEYQVTAHIITIANGEGLKICEMHQLVLSGGNVGCIEGFMIDGDVRNLITVTAQYVRPRSPFTNTESLQYNSASNITFWGMSSMLFTPLNDSPFPVVYETEVGAGADWNVACANARTYFNSKPSYAVTTQLAEDVRCGDVGVLPEYSSYAQNYLVSQTFPAYNTRYDRLIIARKDVKYPGCEMAFLWYTGGPTEACIVKQTNEQIIHATTMTGDFITIANSQSITIAAFTGVIKYKLNGNPMITMDASNGLSLTMSTDLNGISAFFCYPDVPNKYVEYTAGFSADTRVRTTFKNAPKKSVTGAVGSGTSWGIWVLYDNNDAPSTAVVHDIDMKQGAGTWYNVRTNSSTNHDSSTTYNITGAGSIQGGMDAGDAQFTADTFEALAQKVRQYFDSH